MENQKPLVSLKNLSVHYEEKEVLHQVNLTIWDHDFIGIIGPNGGGKTTLIKAILKNIPYTGNVDYGPYIEVNNRCRIGYLPQLSSIDKAFPISVREVVLSGLQSTKTFLGHYTSDDRRKAESLLDMTGIIHLQDRSIGELSGGESQRMMLCRALISDPRLLILDEPNNFVDNRFEGELYAILRELSQRMAIVVVSHDIGTITSYIKTVVCVNRTVHRHNSNIITAEQLANYNCPLQVISHGEVPHTVLLQHPHHHGH